MAIHKVFISYHHDYDQKYKEALIEFGKRYSIFVDRSVDTGDIPDIWTNEQIRRTIRDRYLRDSTVTVVLVGTETRRRKLVDWEIHSSMYDGSVNKRSGIVVINLPGISNYFNAPLWESRKATNISGRYVMDSNRPTDGVRALVSLHARPNHRQPHEVRGHDLRRSLGTNKRGDAQIPD